MKEKVQAATVGQPGLNTCPDNCLYVSECLRSLLPCCMSTGGPASRWSAPSKVLVADSGQRHLELRQGPSHSQPAETATSGTGWPPATAAAPGPIFLWILSPVCPARIGTPPYSLWSIGLAKCGVGQRAPIFLHILEGILQSDRGHLQLVFWVPPAVQ